MEYRSIKYAGNLGLFIAFLVLFGCNNHNDIYDRLNLADSLMTHKPDSVLTILNDMDVSRLGSNDISARYALLKSMALDKNHIDTTTFDVLQPAIDYYIKNGTPDEQLRTYYYKGRIYQNQGDDDAAMRSFMDGCDLREMITDSLLLAHTFVAQGTLFLKQYKTSEFICNNMAAANLYGAIGKDILEIKSYTNALDGYIIQNNQSAADSLISICLPLIQKNPDGEVYLFPSILSYTIEFCPPDDIKAFLDKYSDLKLSQDEAMNFAQGYSKIGEHDKALNLLSAINLSGSTLDSLKYASIKIGILEKQGKYEQALHSYKDYSAMLEHYQKKLLSQDLLFSDKKHQLEIENLIEIQNRDRIIWGTLCGIFGLVILAGWLYYRSYRNKAKRILVEKDNDNLRLEQDNLRQEKEKAELERDKKTLEITNLKLEISLLKSERDNLKDLQEEQTELAKPIQDVIKIRLDMLNGLLAKEISNNESYSKPYNKWIETIHNDKKKFINSTRLAFAASHPKFMEYLEKHGLSIDEINYLCLYAIGLRGKEVGKYIQKSAITS